MTGAADTERVGIVGLAAAGDEIAFRRLVSEHHDDMRRLCVFITRDPALAEDAAQAAWAVAWRKLGSLREPERVRPWLLRIAANEAKRLWGRRARRNEIERWAAPGVRGGIDPASGIDRLDALAALERLKPDERALIAMRYVMGLDATELAAATDSNPGAVRQRLKRLLDRLREDLER